MNKAADSKVVFKLLVNCVRPNLAYLIAHNTALQAGAIAKYNLKTVELKTFTYASGSQSLSIDSSILGSIPKRLLFAMVDNKHFLGSTHTNPFNLHPYDMDSFSLYVNGKQIASDGLSLNTDNEKGSVMAYRTLFQGIGIHHSNAGLQVTHAMFVSGYFMLLFDLTPDYGASEGHTSHLVNGNIRIERKSRRHYRSRPPAYCTRNTTSVSTSIRYEPL